LSIAFLSHGDTKHVILLPGSVAECFEFAGAAFDLTEQLQTPIFVLSDLDIGMNNWMSEPFAYPDKPIARGKVLSAADLDRLGGFARYKDVDGDGIGYRTLPGTMHPQAAYFTRGSGHNETARSLVPKPVVVQTGKSEGVKKAIGLIAFGSSDFAVLESRDQMKKEYGVETDYLRIRAYPFSCEIHDFVASHERIYVIEQNRDAQMMSLLKLDLAAGEIVKLRSLRHFNGLPIDARSVTDELVMQEGL
jgi:2-oxoglutarate ferredoxin oxidoreductase subunit alpha